MREEQSPAVFQIVRYGLPIIVFIFYFTVSLSFAYTPDSTYLFLQSARTPSLASLAGVSLSPFFLFLVNIGGWLRLDGLLTVKVLSLFFCSLAVLCLYLLAVEVLNDRLTAFCAALVVALEPWLLQLAPSGSAMSLGLLLSLAVLFFTHREEYYVAAFLIGLCTLVFWEAVGLLFAVAGGLFASAGRTHRTERTALRMGLVFLCAVLPWLLYAGLTNAPLLPVALPLGEFPNVGLAELLVSFLLAGCTVAGMLVLAATRERGNEILRNGIGVCGWILWLVVLSVLDHSDMIRLVLPLLTIYAFLGATLVVVALRRERAIPSLVVVVSGLLLLLQQIEFNTVTRPFIREAMEEAQVWQSAAVWLRARTDGGTTVAAEKPGIVGFYAYGRVRSYEHTNDPTADWIVTSDNVGEGFEVAYRPMRPGGELSVGRDAQVAVWRKR